MRVNQGRLSADEARRLLQMQLDYYLDAPGELLPTAGLPFESQAQNVYTAALKGDDPQPAVDAAWAAFYAVFPDAE